MWLISIPTFRNDAAKGHDSLRVFIQTNVAANVQFGVPPDAHIDGNKLTWTRPVATEFFQKWGISPVEVHNTVVVEGRIIKSWSPYYTLRSVARIEKACDTPEGRNVPVFAGTCAEFVQSVRAYTVRLIESGIAPNE